MVNLSREAVVTAAATLSVSSTNGNGFHPHPHPHHHHSHHNHYHNHAHHHNNNGSTANNNYDDCGQVRLLIRSSTITTATTVNITSNGDDSTQHHHHHHQPQRKSSLSSSSIDDQMLNLKQLQQLQSTTTTAVLPNGTTMPVSNGSCLNGTLSGGGSGEDEVDHCSNHRGHHDHLPVVTLNNANLIGLAVEDVEPDTVDEVLNDQHCLLCNAPFNLLLNKRFLCKVCALSVCRNCSLFDDPDWICTVCDQQRAISSQLNCQSWLCKRIKSFADKELIHLINAKLRFEVLHSTQTSSNVNTINGAKDEKSTTVSVDNDHHHCTKSSFLDASIGNHLEHLIALRSDVELIVVKLLGIETIDYAHCGLLFEDVQYLDLVQAYTERLASQLLALQESIYATQSSANVKETLSTTTISSSSLPTPTEAYASLKSLLNEISEQSFVFTHLRSVSLLQLEQFLRDCQSYEHLLANSIVNQIVEVSQTRFLTTGSASFAKVSGLMAAGSVSGHYSPISLSTVTPLSSHHSFGSHHGHRVRSSCSGASSSLYAHSNDGSVSNVKSKLMAGEYGSTDYDELEYDSNGFEDDDELRIQEEGEEEEEYEEVEEEQQDHAFGGVDLDFDTVKVNFPEAGVDLVDSRKYPSVESNLSQDSGIKLIDNSSSWQDNWRFKKHKENKSYHQYHLNSDIHFGYMALALSDPVPMLIPNPSQPFSPLIGEAEVDTVSDLSEHDSETSSVLFSDEENEELNEEIEPDDELAEGEEVDSAELEAKKRNAKTAAILRAAAYKSQHLAAAARAAKLAAVTSATSGSDAKAKRWTRIKVPDFVPSELRTICSLMPNSREPNVEYVPCITIKPGNASVHSGIVAQFCCKASGLQPLYFAWYKDGRLVACSDQHRAKSTTVSMEENEQTKQIQSAQVFFGVRFPHRRTVEQCGNSGSANSSTSSLSSYRLIVFNENECILEMRKTNATLSGIYSVVAYNHAGHDWADFSVVVDRAHYAANNVPPINSTTTVVPVLSPRPTRRRPQNKQRKSLVKDVIEHQQQLIIDYLTKSLMRKTGGGDHPTTTPKQIGSVANSSSSSSPILNSLDGPNQQLLLPTKTQISNFKQRTWPERVAAEVIQHNFFSGGGSDGGDVENGSNSPGDGTLSFSHTNTNCTAKVSSVDQHIDEYVTDSQSIDLATQSPEAAAVLNDTTTTTTNEEKIETFEQQEVSLQTMTIADREHRKWLNPDVELQHNPYTVESIEARTRASLHQINGDDDATVTDQTNDEHGDGDGDTDDDDDDDESGFEKKKFFSDRDISRYKRDYYMPKNHSQHENLQVFSILNTLGGGGGANSKPKKKKKQPQNGDAVVDGSLESNETSSSLNSIDQAQQLISNETTSTSTTDEQMLTNLNDQNDQTPTTLSTTLVVSIGKNDNVDEIPSVVDATELLDTSSSTPTIISKSKPTIVAAETKPNTTTTTTTGVSSSSSNSNGNVLKKTMQNLNSSVSQTTTSALPKARSLKDSELARLPSVKNLVSLFSNSASSSSKENLSNHSKTLSSRPSTPQHTVENGFVKSSKVANQNNNGDGEIVNGNKHVSTYKVFSLTARSMPREFREQTSKQLPRLTNRISLSNEMLGITTTTTTTTIPVDITEQNEQSQSTMNSLNSSTVDSLVSVNTTDSFTSNEINGGGGGDVSSFHSSSNGSLTITTNNDVIHW